MIQTVIADGIVLAAALWLVWTFAPGSWRARLTRKRALPAYDAALQAEELAGEAPAPPHAE